jgi:hypothetical protein
MARKQALFAKSPLKRFIMGTAFYAISTPFTHILESSSAIFIEMSKSVTC